MPRSTSHMLDNVILFLPRDSHITALAYYKRSPLPVEPLLYCGRLNLANVEIMANFHSGQNIPIAEDPDETTCAKYRHDPQQ